MPRLNGLRQDVVLAVRLLRKAPTFTVAAVLTLALGIGVNVGVFSVVNAFILSPLPVSASDRLVVIASRSTASSNLGGLSFPDLQEFRSAAPDVFEDVAGYTVGFAGVRAEGARPERVLVTWVTGNYFPLLGVQPALGRFIGDAEGRPGRTDPVAVLGYSTWRRRFGGDGAVIGAMVRVNGHPCTIVGVAPRGFLGTFAFSESELFLPLNFAGTGDLGRRDERPLHSLARLRPGTALSSAQATAAAVARRLEAQFSVTNAGVTVEVVPERLARPEESGARSNALAASLVLGLAGLVLVVACVNVSNLMLARAVGRRKELAIRVALGAGRVRLVQQVITEALVIAVLGGVAGVLLGGWSARLLGTVRPGGDLPVRFDFGADARVVAFAAVIVVGIGLVTGTAVAFRMSGGDLERVLREPGFAASSGGGRWLRRGLIVAQVASCLVLLVMAGLFTRSLARAEQSDLGFMADGVLNLHMDVGQLGYSDPRAQAFFDEVERDVRRVPGIETVSYAFTVPMGYVRLDEAIEAAGDTSSRAGRLHAGKNMVSPEYFATMGIPLVRGRAFTDEDRAGARPVAVVNRCLADLLWPGQDAIGRRFSASGAAGPWFEVVGVTRTGNDHLLFEDPQPYFYVPMAQQPSSMRVMQVRSSMPPESLAPALTRLVQQREPDLPLYDVQSMASALDGGYGFFLLRLAAIAVAVFGALALALAAVGIYGVVSFLASQRSREFGVRIALGAAPRDILRLVVTDGVTTSAIGIGLGLAIATTLAPIIGGFLFGVSARDPLTLLVVAPILAGVAIVASLVPAWRALGVDPTVTLRAE